MVKRGRGRHWPAGEWDTSRYMQEKVEEELYGNRDSDFELES